MSLRPRSFERERQRRESHSHSHSVSTTGGSGGGSAGEKEKAESQQHQRPASLPHSNASNGKAPSRHGYSRSLTAAVVPVAVRQPGTHVHSGHI